MGHLHHLADVEEFVGISSQLFQGCSVLLEPPQELLRFQLLKSFCDAVVLLHSKLIHHGFGLDDEESHHIEQAQRFIAQCQKYNQNEYDLLAVVVCLLVLSLDSLVGRALLSLASFYGFDMLPDRQFVLTDFKGLLDEANCF